MESMWSNLSSYTEMPKIVKHTFKYNVGFKRRYGNRKYFWIYIAFVDYELSEVSHDVPESADCTAFYMEVMSNIHDEIKRLTTELMKEKVAIENDE